MADERDERLIITEAAKFEAEAAKARAEAEAVGERLAFERLKAEAEAAHIDADRRVLLAQAETN